MIAMQLCAQLVVARGGASRASVGHVMRQLNAHGEPATRGIFESQLAAERLEETGGRSEGNARLGRLLVQFTGRRNQCRAPCYVYSRPAVNDEYLDQRARQARTDSNRPVTRAKANGITHDVDNDPL
jgi:hypothetical protein